MGCCGSQPKGKQQILKGGAGGKNQDFREAYDVGKKLGEGTFGMVFDCTPKKGGDGTVFAVKMLEHQSSWWGGMTKAQSEQWEALAQETDMLRKMDHPNVVKLHDVYVDRSFLYLVMDKYANSLISSVLPLLQQGRAVMPFCVLGEMTAQMLSSIVYLHDLKIVHRDVKADNYLVDMDNFKGKNFKVVLTDLGTARQLEDGVFLKDLLGTIQYWAPEVIARCYTNKVDCWAIGVVLWCMLTLKFPFNTAQETYTKVLTFRADKMTEPQFELIQMLLNKDPNKRVSAKDAMDHKFVVESRAKHKAMIDGGKGEDDTDFKGASTSDQQAADSKAVGFGDNKKKVAKEVQDRRQQQMKEAEDRFANGEKDTIGLDAKVSAAKATDGPKDSGDDVMAIDRQRKGETKQYSWWSEKRAKDKDVPDINTDCTKQDAKAKSEDDPAREQAGDMALTEPSDVAELTAQLKDFNVDTSKFGQGQAKTLDGLFAELQKQECRMILRGTTVIRVVDLLALRVRTKATGGKLLIESDQKLADGRERKVNRLPAVMRQAGGSGIDRAKAEIRRLLKSELGTTPEVVQVQLRGSQQESTSYKQDSQSYPGLTTVYRKTVFDATINAAAPGPELKKLGLPAESIFSTSAADGTQTTYKWVTDDELKADNVVVSFPTKVTDEIEGLKALLKPSWTEAIIKETFTTHKVDQSKFGVGTARSVKQFTEETNSGETKLFSDGAALTRQLEILVVKIKNPMAAVLVETGHTFGKGQKREKMALPATKVRPFEDKVWAVRRLLSEVDIPYSSSKIIFGPTRVEKSESPSYPGITTVYVKQVVEVQLLAIDVNNLDGDDVGRDKWFTQKLAA